MANNILIKMFGTIAELEQETICKRQAEGVESGKANGKNQAAPHLYFPQIGMRSILLGKQER